MDEIPMSPKVDLEMVLVLPLKKNLVDFDWTFCFYFLFFTYLNFVLNQFYLKILAVLNKYRNLPLRVQCGIKCKSSGRSSLNTMVLYIKGP